MKYDNTLSNTVSTINEGCCCEAPMPSRTVTDNLREIEEALIMIEANVDRIRKHIWFGSQDENSKDIEVRDMDSQIVNQLEKSRRIAKKVMDLADRLGA